MNWQMALENGWPNLPALNGEWYQRDVQQV